VLASAFLCHQTSCAPTSQKSQSSPLKSLCPSHFCFNHHQRPSQRAIFARTLRPAILVCSDGAPTWWIEEASARGRRTHTLGHREALVLLRPALARALLEAEADHVTAGTVEYLARPPERTALLPVLRERCLQPHPGQLTTTAPLQRRKTTKGHHGCLHLATTLPGDAATLRSIGRCPRLIGSVWRHEKHVPGPPRFHHNALSAMLWSPCWM